MDLRSASRWRNVWAVVGASLLLTLSSCAQPSTATGPRTEITGSGHNLSVLYAGSMTKVMEQVIAPDYRNRTGVQLDGQGAGSNQLAQMIVSGLKQPDVFVSADPSVNSMLMRHQPTLERWFMTLAGDEMVIAYNPRSRYAAALQKAGQAGDWYQVMEAPGFLLGRTDPKLDPKGRRSILAVMLAERYYHQPGLVTRLLGPVDNAKQVFPEEVLLSRLAAGQLDAVFAYRHEAVEWGLPYIALPAQVNLGDPALAADYAKVQLKLADGQVETGAPIVFTIAELTNAPHPVAAEAWIRDMLSGGGHEQLIRDGFTAVPPLVGGDVTAVPAALRGLARGMWSTRSGGAAH